MDFDGTCVDHRYPDVGKDGTILVDFGKPVAWIGLGAEDARAFANLLLKRATEVQP